MNKPFKLNIADGSSFSFHKDGSYDYHSFDGHDTTYQPVSDGDSGLDYAADAPVAHFKRGYGIPHDIKFADGNLIKELKWTFYYTDPAFDVIRNDGWTEKTYPNTNTYPGSAPITRDVVTSPDGKSYGLYFIGAGTLNKYGPWMYETYAGGWKHMVKYDDVTAPGARIVYTDPDHTVLPSDCSDMFADFKTAGIMDMSQIGRFDASNVTNMSGMFKNNASVVDASVLKNWDTSKVTDMSSMFELSSVSDLSVLSHWNLDKVKTMAYMFSGTKDLHTLDGARNLSLASLTDMSYMFSNHGGSLDVSAMGTWDTSRITSMANLFDGKGGWSDPSLGGLTELNGVDKIRMDSVTDINNMFARNYALKSIGGIGGLDVSHVQKAYEVFEDCRSLTALDLSRWNTKNFTSIYNMFFMRGSGDTASKLASLDLTGWDTSQVTSMSNVFRGCAGLTSLPKGVADWQTGNVTAMNGMFYGCTGIATPFDLTGWNTSNVTAMEGMFQNCVKLPSVNLAGWNMHKVRQLQDMFQSFGADVTDKDVDLSSISGWKFHSYAEEDTYGSLSMTTIFKNCGVKTLDIADWDISDSWDLSRTFQDMPNLVSVDLSKWDTRNIHWLDETFSGDKNLVSVGDLHTRGHVWDTSKAWTAERMFNGCQKLKNLDLSGWDLSNVSTQEGHVTCEGSSCTVYSELGLSGMFSGDSSLETLKADGWKFAGVTAIGNMFNGATGLKLLSLTDWDASNVDNLDNAFTGIGAESGMKLDLSNWKVNKNVSIDLPLRDTNVTAVDLSGWDTTVDNGFRPRFSARLNQLTVGPKTLLRPEYFAPGAEPATDSQYTGQWVEASAKKDATQTCTASDGTTYTAAGESWTSCGRPAGSSATESMRQHANDRASEATYLWEQHNTVHFAGLDPTNPRAPYDDSVMAPKQSYGVDATSIKVDGDTTPVDVHGMTVALPAKQTADDFINVGWKRDGDTSNLINRPSSQLAVPSDTQVVRAMWMRKGSAPIILPTEQIPPKPSPVGPPSTPSGPSTPSTPSEPNKPNKPSTPGEPSEPTTPSGPSTPGTPNNPATPSAGGSPSALQLVPQATAVQPAPGPLTLTQALPAPAAAPRAGAPQVATQGGHDGTLGGGQAPRQQAPKPLCVGSATGAAYVVDAAGYVVPSAQRCSVSASPTPVYRSRRGTSFPWRIVLVPFLFLILLARRNKFLYAQHRSAEETKR